MAADKRDLWVGWTRDAMDKYEMPDKVEDAEELANDMADVAVAYADMMLEEYEDRFGGSGGRERRPAKRRRKEEPE
jgi:hypothetical protein